MTHYFETPAEDGPEHLVPMRLWGFDVELLSAPGVFSGRRLDPGTAVLLRTCPPPAGGREILDLGCGIGPLACALALAVPEARVTAVDVNRRAVELTARNAARLKVAERVAALAPEAVDPAARFDELWSNPPIRIGKPALHRLLLTWLERLTPKGTAKLVVARHLGADSLAAWLDAAGWQAERLGSAKGYRVLAVRRQDA
ncbi:MAG: methyltransferase [Propionibacteriaceae bacterium]|jgi:16S rRNA G1207 methylase RsmC|nr:methyltransferase [Propionibacteriaceae bacterium]